MRYKLLIIIVLFFNSLFLDAQNSDQCRKISVDVLRMLQTAQNDSLHSLMDATMKKAIQPDQLAMIWPSFIENDGRFLKQENLRETMFEGYLIVETNLIFEQKAYTMRLSFNKEEKISGLFFVPIRTQRSRETTTQENEIWKEEDIIIKSGEVELPGTICYPKNSKSYPLVVFVHGSGPNDRDETIGPNKLFAQLAHSLAEKGIGSIRYDKRTYVIQQTGNTEIPHSGLEEVVVFDAMAAIDLALRTVPFDNRVFLLGHSLGASLAPQIAGHFPQLGGVIMMAASAFSIEDEILRQTKYLLKKDGFKCAERKAYKDMKQRVENVKNLKVYMAKGEIPNLPLTNDTVFWNDITKMNSIKDALKLQMPVLILQGERDYQVTMQSYEKWMEAVDGKKNFMFKSYPSLNHLFLEGKGKSYPDEYAIKGNVPNYILSDISLWILSKN